MVYRRHNNNNVIILLYLCFFFLSSCIGAQSASATATLDDVLDLDDNKAETNEKGPAEPQAEQENLEENIPSIEDEEDVVIEMTPVMSDDDDHVVVDPVVSASTDEGTSTTSHPPTSDEPSLTKARVEEGEAMASAATSATDDLSGTPMDDLDSLTNEQLESICTDLGFLIQKEDGTDLTREDYLEAATKCKEMETEIQSILDDNPELAVELDAEIERMKLEKERLEQEQASLLDKKSGLEEKLQAADVDLTDVGAATGSSSASSTPSQATKEQQQPDSVDGVLRQSFEMLFDRVGRDLRLVGKVLRFAVLQPTGTGATVVWRTLGPTVERGVQQVMLFADGVAVPALGKQLKTVVLPIVLRIASPMLAQGKAILKATVIKLRTVDAIEKGFTIAGAFLGPLKNSLGEGWASIRPDVVAARQRLGTWLVRLRNEKVAAAAAS